MIGPSNDRAEDRRLDALLGALRESPTPPAPPASLLWARMEADALAALGRRHAGGAASMSRRWTRPLVAAACLAAVGLSSMVIVRAGRVSPSTVAARADGSLLGASETLLRAAALRTAAPSDSLRARGATLLALARAGTERNSAPLTDTRLLADVEYALAQLVQGGDDAVERALAARSLRERRLLERLAAAARQKPSSPVGGD